MRDVPRTSMHKSPPSHPRRDVTTQLQELDRYIADGRDIMRRQARELREMRRDGQAPVTARTLLAALCETIAALQRHRTVLRTLATAQLDANSDRSHPVSQPADA